MSSVPLPKLRGEEQLLAGVGERHPVAVQLDHVADLAEADRQLRVQGEPGAVGDLGLVEGAARGPGVLAALGPGAGDEAKQGERAERQE